MCGVCGCGDESHIAKKHVHVFAQPAPRVIQLELDILSKNNQFAAENRRQFQEQSVLALNLVSSPGSGKTSLLVETIKQLQAEYAIAVIEGDQQTSCDAERIQATGVPAIQINTGKGCHLEADRIGQAWQSLQAQAPNLLFIENVGNLVCPSGFDLGEAHKVVILSVTEGEDKPLKYPDMFHAADLMLLNKIDLLPYLDFDVERCLAYALQVNPRLQILLLSAKTAEGMPAWLDWIKRQQLKLKQPLEVL